MRWVRWRRGAWLRSIARRRSARLRSVDWSLGGISTSLRVASWRVARGLLVLARLHDHSMPWLHRNAGLSLRCGEDFAPSSQLAGLRVTRVPLDADRWPGLAAYADRHLARPSFTARLLGYFDRLRASDRKPPMRYLPC